jgi:hypothetical protein
MDMWKVDSRLQQTSQVDEMGDIVKSDLLKELGMVRQSRKEVLERNRGHLQDGTGSNEEKYVYFVHGRLRL